MNETEITVQVFEDEKTINEKLMAKGYEASREFKLFDWYFTKYDDVGNMSYEDLINSSFLVRYIEDEDGKNAHICYKSKEFDKDGNVIGEEKIKTNIDNLDNTIKILKNAKLNNWVNVKNYSTVYKNDRGFEIALQKIEGLGLFFEIEEDESLKGQNSEEKFKALCEVVENLGIDIGNDYSCKKPFMLLKK